MTAGNKRILRKCIATGLLAGLLMLAAGCMDAAAPVGTSEPAISADMPAPSAAPDAALTATPSAAPDPAASLNPTETPEPAATEDMPAPSASPETAETATPAPSGTPASLETPAPSATPAPDPGAPAGPMPSATPDVPVTAEPSALPEPAATLPPIELRLGWDEAAGLGLTLGMTREDLIWELAVRGFAYTAMEDTLTVSARRDGAILPVWMTVSDTSPLSEVSAALTALGDDPALTLTALAERLTGYYGAPAEDGWTALVATLSEPGRASLAAALSGGKRCTVRWEAAGEHAVLTVTGSYDGSILAELAFGYTERVPAAPGGDPSGRDAGF